MMNKRIFAALSVFFLALALAIATLLAVPLGFAIGMHRRLEAYVDPLIELLRPISGIAWIPLGLFIFGVGNALPVFIMVYVAFRFDLRFAPGGVIALMHDATIVAGAYILFQKEFTLGTVAAILTVIGYSINDTIVIYDRIREEMVKYKGKPLPEIINIAAGPAAKQPPPKAAKPGPWSKNKNKGKGKGKKKHIL